MHVCTCIYEHTYKLYTPVGGVTERDKQAWHKTTVGKAYVLELQWGGNS